MIVTDLDNTLVRRDNSISDYSVTVLKKCQSKGIKIVFATARSKKASSRFLERFTPDIFIGCGGALVTVGDEIIHCRDIPADISNRLIKECLNSPTIMSILATNEDVSLTNDRNELFNEDTAHYQYDDFSCDYKHRYLKISLVSTSQPEVNRIVANYPMLDLLRYTGEDLYRFANKDALKWNAVKATADYFNIATDTIIAFGDDINDLEMIAKCGSGVAVENAVKEVKNIADYICGSNDNDGVASWIEKHIF